MKRFALAAAAAAAALAHAAGAAESSGDYATDLGRVYGGYQRMLAMKEACDTAVPASRPANARAFAAWEGQNRLLIADLRRRVTEMIRAASKDADEYVRNLGNYEGAILLDRKEYRDTLLALGRDELRAQCQQVPDMLKGPDADFAKVYAAELETLRRRK